MPKLPAPPVPSALKPPPPRPGDPNGAKTPVHHAAEAGATVVDWVDERTSLSGAGRWLMFRKVPEGTNWFYTLGSATMFAFLSQAVTGVFLAMYYRPDPSGGAYESIRYVTNDVFLGQFVRGMHKWGSSVMVILIFLHMGRTFFFGAYKYPRELNWIIGVFLLASGLAEGFTGYLLPWDQTSYWATTVGINLNGTAPFLGPYIAQFLQGGTYINASTLSRFYSIHMLILPGAIAALIGLHLYLVIRLGVTSPPWSKEAAGTGPIQPDPSQNGSGANRSGNGAGAASGSDAKEGVRG
jgi:ubiquinol-cytochrome c reductase cytochrome b subunit/menaquinol-cytochrome c reductase cytochrome b subunit